VTTGIVCFPALASLHGVSYVRFPTYVPCALGKRLLAFYYPFVLARLLANLLARLRCSTGTHAQAGQASGEATG